MPHNITAPYSITHSISAFVKTSNCFTCSYWCNRVTMNLVTPSISTSANGLFLGALQSAFTVIGMAFTTCAPVCGSFGRFSSIPPIADLIMYASLTNSASFSSTFSRTKRETGDDTQLASVMLVFAYLILERTTWATSARWPAASRYVAFWSVCKDRTLPNTAVRDSKIFMCMYVHDSKFVETHFIN